MLQIRIWCMKIENTASSSMVWPSTVCHTKTHILDQETLMQINLKVLDLPCEALCTNGSKMALLHCWAEEQLQIEENMNVSLASCKFLPNTWRLLTDHKMPVVPVFYHEIPVVRLGMQADIEKRWLWNCVNFNFPREWQTPATLKLGIQLKA